MCPFCAYNRASRVPKPGRFFPARIDARQLLLALLALCLAGSGLRAGERADFAEMDLDELMNVKVPMVYGASKHEQRITEAPSSVSIVTREEIQFYGHRTLADVLRGVRGLYVTSDRGYSYIGVRGVNRPGDYGGRVLITLDGHRLNEPVFDSAFNGPEFPLDVDLIERVEVIRGPGSSLYGNNAFFGVVNVVTRQGRDLQGLETAAVTGDHGTYGARASYGRLFTSGFEVLLSGSWHESQGHEHLPFTDSFSGQRLAGPFDDYLRERKVLGSVRYGDLALRGVYGSRDKTLAPGAYFSLTDPQPRIRDDRGFLELKYERELVGEWQLLSRLFYDAYYYDGDYFYNAPSPPFVINNLDDTDVSSWGGEVRASKPLFEKHRLTFGIEGRNDVHIHQRNFDANPRLTYIDKDTSSGNLGVFGQAEIAVRTNLMLNAGLRYDYYNTFGSTLNPRAGLVYHPWSATTFKALYGHAYRAPNAFETDYEVDIYKGNHDLDPERIRAYEAVWEQGIGRNLRLTGTLFYNDIHDLITQIQDPADNRLVFRNTDSIDVLGTEWELEAALPCGLRARGSYTFAEATDNEAEARLSNSPRHLGKFQLIAPVYPDKAFLAFELLAMSARTSVAGDRVNGHTLGNVTLFSRNLVKDLELSASMYNVWNTKYSDPVGPDFGQDTIPQDRRSFRVKLSYRF